MSIEAQSPAGVLSAARGHFSIPEHRDYALIDLGHYQSLYGQPALGGYRAVFYMGDGNMLKFPICDKGMSDNGYEGMSAVGEADGIPFTSGRQEFSPSGFPVLVVEKVEPISRRDARFPGWGDFVDCGQVGVTADGRVVAYDL